MSNSSNHTFTMRWKAATKEINQFECFLFNRDTITDGISDDQLHQYDATSVGRTSHPISN